ncbi:MAG: exopolysaccharide biosynthesis protein [Actinomycetes bacterium]
MPALPESNEETVMPVFSDELEKWLGSDKPKTLAGLEDVLEKRSFAVLILFLMSVPALPLPTGGVTHVFEVITILLGLQMVIGLRAIWLPAKWRQRELGEATTGKALPFIVRRVRWFEKRSKPRGQQMLQSRWFSRVTGAVVIAFSAGAMFAPPFSGLDTLPALGAVVLCLGVILGDLFVYCAGILIGVGGISLVLFFGAAVVHAVKMLFQ